MLVLSLNARNAYSHRKVGAYAEKFDHFYLKGDEPLSAESDVTTTVLLDPLYEDEYVGFEDVISSTAARLTKNGIPEEKLIIGLSALARGYSLASRNETYHGAGAYEFAVLNSKLTDGRVPYQDVSD